MDLIERMRTALPVEIEVSKAEWLEARESAAAAVAAKGGGGQAAAAQAGGGADRELTTTSIVTTARIPREVPALPKGHLPRKAILEGIKRRLFALAAKDELRSASCLWAPRPKVLPQSH